MGRWTDILLNGLHFLDRLGQVAKPDLVLSRFRTGSALARWSPNDCSLTTETMHRRPAYWRLRPLRHTIASLGRALPGRRPQLPIDTDRQPPFLLILQPWRLWPGLCQPASGLIPLGAG